MAAAVARELADMKAILEPKVADMDGKINAMTIEVAKLPALEEKMEGVAQRLTAYTEALATQQNETTAMMMQEVMKMATALADKDIKIAAIQAAVDTLAKSGTGGGGAGGYVCLLYTSPSPRDGLLSRMPSSA